MATITSQTTPNTTGAILIAIKTLLVSAGWTVAQSGTGSSGAGSGVYNPSGDSVTTTALLNNPDAWFRIVSPLGASGPQFCFQRGSGTTDARITYSAFGVSVAGTASTIPTMTSQITLRSPGFDAWPPSFVSSLYRLWVAADNAAPYGFWFNLIQVGGGNMASGLALIPMSTFTPGDTNPYIVACNDSASSWRANNLFITSSSPTTNSVVGYLPTTSSVVTIPAFVPSNQNYFGGSVNAIASTVGAGGFGSDPITGKDVLFPIQFIRPVTLGTAAWKGATSFMRWKGTLRANGDTATVTTPRDFIHIGDTVLPWDGSVPLI